MVVADCAWWPSLSPLTAILKTLCLRLFKKWSTVCVCGLIGYWAVLKRVWNRMHVNHTSLFRPSCPILLICAQRKIEKVLEIGWSFVIWSTWRGVLKRVVDCFIIIWYIAHWICEDFRSYYIICTNAKIIAKILFYARRQYIVSNLTCAEIFSAEVEEQ